MLENHPHHHPRIEATLEQRVELRMLGRVAHTAAGEWHELHPNFGRKRCEFRIGEQHRLVPCPHESLT